MKIHKRAQRAIQRPTAVCRSAEAPTGKRVSSRISKSEIELNPMGGRCSGDPVFRGPKPHTD